MECASAACLTTSAALDILHPRKRPARPRKTRLHVISACSGRAVLDAYQIGRREPFPLYQIVPTVAEVMRRPYPELAESASRVATTIKQEEEQFLRNLENGLRILNDTFQKTRARRLGYHRG